MIIGISGKIGSGKDTVGKVIQYLTHSKELPTYEWWLKNYHINNLCPKSNWQIKKFADKLKDMVCLLLGCAREQLEDREFKEKELGEEWWYWKLKNKLIPYIGNENYFSDPYLIEESLIKLTPRKLLQLLGTECGRQIIHPNIWVNALMSEYKPFIKDYPQLTTSGGKELVEGESYRMGKAILPNWIITDVRFFNEAQAVKDKGGINIRINRNFCNCRSTTDEIVYCEKQCPTKDISHPSETALDKYENWDFVINNHGTLEELIEQVKDFLTQYKLI